MLLLRGVLFVVVIAALAVVILSLLRRTPRAKADDPSEDSHAASIGGKAPAALSAPPQSSPSKALARAEVFHKLHELALGTTLKGPIRAEHAKAAEGVAIALHTAATDPRYAPRRPLLLPQLLNAVGDGDTSRGELARMIARDPALVGSLLRLANSPVYRRSAQPIESVERAVTVMGTQGIRSLVAAALVQPVFRTGDGEVGRFPEIVWEHTYRAAAAAEVHAVAAEGADPFAAQLLALVTGLAELVVFRVAVDQYARASLRADAAAIAALLDDHTPGVASRIAESWELSSTFLEALDEQLRGKPARPASALGRSLKFGLVAGALAVLEANGAIDADTGVASFVAAGGIGPKLERLWGRFTARREDDAA